MWGQRKIKMVQSFIKYHISKETSGFLLIFFLFFPQLHLYLKKHSLNPHLGGKGKKDMDLVPFENGAGLKRMRHCCWPRLWCPPALLTFNPAASAKSSFRAFWLLRVESLRSFQASLFSSSYCLVALFYCSLFFYYNPSFPPIDFNKKWAGVNLTVWPVILKLHILLGKSQTC